MLEYTKDPNPAVRQAAAYGLGVCAQVGGDAFKPFVPDAFARLVAVAQDKDAKKTPNHAYASENAASSMGKIIRYQTSAIDPQNTQLSALLSLWLSLLPVNTDKLESKIVYDHLCFFYETGFFQQHLVGREYQNVGKILRILAEVLETDLIDKQTMTPRIALILRQLVATAPPHILHLANASLSDQHKSKLQKAAAAS